MKPSNENVTSKYQRVSSASCGTRKISKSMMLHTQNGKRAASSPQVKGEPSLKKRPAIGDITNAIPSFHSKKQVVKKSQISLKDVSGLKLKNKKNKDKSKTKQQKIVGKENQAFSYNSSRDSNALIEGKKQPPVVKEDEPPEKQGDCLSPFELELSSSNLSAETFHESTVSTSADPAGSQEQLGSATSITTKSPNTKNSMTAEERSNHPNSGTDPCKPDSVKTIDEDQDPCSVCEYAESVFKNMKESESDFKIRKYLENGSSLTPQMRAILIDWLVEIQENFELYHETLYLAVSIVDLYLQDNKCTKDNLQLVGATALFISCKVEERYPPPLDDFIYICDDIYTGENFREMEKSILTSLGFRLHIPSSYRFLRRLGRIAGVTMEVLTLARYILESSLTDYEFVDASPSLIAAGVLNLALRMKDAGEWDATLEYYSGYSEEVLIPMSRRLNAMIKEPPKPHVMNVRKKYSHPVFYKVAEVQPLEEI